MLKRVQAKALSQMSRNATLSRNTISYPQKFNVTAMNSNYRAFSTSSTEKKGFFKKIVGFFVDEAKNLGEVAEVVQKVRAEPAKRRLLDPTQKPYLPPEVKERLEKKDELGHSVDFDSLNLEDAEKETEEEAGPSDVIITADKRTVWAQRLDNAKDALRNSDAYRAVNRAKNQMESSENEAVQRLVDLKYDVQDRLTEMRDEYELSNNKVIQGVRAVERAVTNETDSAFALGELLKLDPAYKPDDLIRDVEEYMIPVIVTGFLRGDVDVMRSALTGTALDAVEGVIAERIKKKQFFDTNILGITHIEISQYSMDNFVPTVTVVAIVQQLKCVRNEKGEIIQGGESNIDPNYYQLTMTRDFHNPDFDWKITDFKYFSMLQLQ